MSILQQLNRAQRREANKGLQKEAARQPEFLREVPREQWPSQPPALRRVWRSRYFLVQEYADTGFTRLSVNRVTIEQGGHWVAEISWDELQRVKAECGYAELWAVEIFPPAAQVVNVANMRHLWLLAEPPAYGWHPSANRAHTHP